MHINTVTLILCVCQYSIIYEHNENPNRIMKIIKYMYLNTGTFQNAWITVNVIQNQITLARNRQAYTIPLYVERKIGSTMPASNLIN